MNARLLSSLVVAIALLASAWTCENAAADWITGTSSYQSFADSPFSGLTFSDYFHLEDFEDGTPADPVNTPGLSASLGFLVQNDFRVDSVDADDGTIDGNGTNGRSYGNLKQYADVQFTFDAVTLSSLPTHVGIVWTDGGSNGSGAPGDFTFEAFDSADVSLGTVTQTLGDGMITGGTAEDRFFGVTHQAGISRITFASTHTSDHTYLEVDHVQYGGGATSVPEPSGLVIWAVGVFFLGAHAHFRRSRVRRT